MVPRTRRSTAVANGSASTTLLTSIITTPRSSTLPAPTRSTKRALFQLSIFDIDRHHRDTLCERLNFIPLSRRLCLSSMDTCVDFLASLPHLDTLLCVALGTLAFVFISVTCSAGSLERLHVQREDSNQHGNHGSQSRNPHFYGTAFRFNCYCIDRNGLR
ncbi:hypothetical protein CABS03_12025 [Colletotrichum abscissum]|uniref:Uncharacterized protein n=1 Tax=Colletotrichum abscissum TaxID=1671311 RepID=A0A9P9XNM3_9PEZI|nr:hypothetical protein CABS02_02544 [Colletotrichum abscissum]